MLTQRQLALLLFALDFLKANYEDLADDCIVMERFNQITEDEICKIKEILEIQFS